MLIIRASHIRSGVLGQHRICLIEHGILCTFVLIYVSLNSNIILRTFYILWFLFRFLFVGNTVMDMLSGTAGWDYIQTLFMGAHSAMQFATAVIETELGI